jgi:hypothetical protein
MGVSLSWIGMQATTGEALRNLGLCETGASGEYFDFPISGVALANG